jgi:hypothetical protein
MERGLAIVAINSTMGQAPGRGPAKMAERHAGYPYLYDETQAVAKAYRAACTPDIFLFDRDWKLVSVSARRQSARQRHPGTGLTCALPLTGAAGGGSAERRPSIGCNIK